MRQWAGQLARWLWGADGDEGLLTLVQSTPVVFVVVGITVLISMLDFMLPEWRPGVGTLSHYLGSSAAWVAHGQWWRLLTGGFVNPPCPGTPSCTGWEHLYGTMLPVGLIGLRVERTLRSRRFLLLYVMVTLAAFLPSQIFFAPGWGYGGGSSGGSHGLYGAILVIAFAERNASRRKHAYFLIASVALVLHITRGLVRNDFHNSAAHLTRWSSAPSSRPSGHWVLAPFHDSVRRSLRRSPSSRASGSSYGRSTFVEPTRPLLALWRSIWSRRWSRVPSGPCGLPATVRANS